MGRTTISLPDDLVERLEPLKSRINISRVCRTALETRVANYERIQKLEEDEMEQLLERLRLEKQQVEQFCYNIGGEKGHEWAIKEASFEDLVSYASPTWVEVQEMSGRPALPGHWGTTEAWADLGQYVEQEGKFYDAKAFTQGFLDAVSDVWDSVKDRI